MTLADTVRPDPRRAPSGAFDVLRAAREGDPIGHRVHTGMAAAYAFALPVATFPEGLAGAVLLVYSLLRLHRTWRSYAILFRQPVMWGLGAWVAWSAMSIAWSSDPAQGWDELQAARAALLPLMIWPVLDGAAGKLHAGNTAAWCAAALCWHASAAMHGRSWIRWSAIALGVVATAGLVMTGSRGPWIAAALTLPACVMVLAIRRRTTRRFAAVLVLLGLLSAVIVWPVASRVIAPRIERAVSEVQRALDEGDYTTSAGLRVAMWQWAGSIFVEAPVWGRGAGCYQSELYDREAYKSLLDRQRNDEDVDYLTRDHPHSTYLYTLARTGAVGGALFAMVLLLAVLNAWRAPPAFAWADGTLFALATWIVGAQFDCFELNASTFGMLTLIVAVTLGGRERGTTC